METHVNNPDNNINNDNQGKGWPRFLGFSLERNAAVLIGRYYADGSLAVFVAAALRLWSKERQEDAVFITNIGSLTTTLGSPGRVLLTSNERFYKNKFVDDESFSRGLERATPGGSWRMISCDRDSTRNFFSYHERIMNDRSWNLQGAQSRGGMAVFPCAYEKEDTMSAALWAEQIPSAWHMAKLSLYLVGGNPTMPTDGPTEPGWVDKLRNFWPRGRRAPEAKAEARVAEPMPIAELNVPARVQRVTPVAPRRKSAPKMPDGFATGEVWDHALGNPNATPEPAPTEEKQD